MTSPQTRRSSPRPILCPVLCVDHDADTGVRAVENRAALRCPLLWAIFLAFLIYRLHVRLTRRLKGPSALVPHSSSPSCAGWVIGPLTALSAAFAAQVGDLLQFAQTTVADQTKRNVLDLGNVPWLAARSIG